MKLNLVIIFLVRDQVMVIQLTIEYAYIPSGTDVNGATVFEMTVH